MKTFLFIVILALVGCSGREVSRVSIGRIVDISPIPAAFNQSTKTQVKTTQRWLTVYSTLNVPLDAEAYIVTYSDGRHYFTCDGDISQYMHICD